MRPLARIPKVAAPTIDDLQAQIAVLRETIAHLLERVEILETRDGLLRAPHPKAT